jgi:hypothetical protein
MGSVRAVTPPMAGTVYSASAMSRPVEDICRRRRWGVVRAVVLLGGALFSAGGLFADDLAIVASTGDRSDQRILGVIPNYQTVSDPAAPFVPLTAKEKWKLAVRESYDPFTAGSAFLAAAFSQRANDHPKYGYGNQAFAQRFGAAMGDFTTQNIFSAAVLASILHQDPRYYRKGPSKSILSRTGYSLSRMVVTKQDSGRLGFNFSGLLGMGLGIAASNIYYPAGSRNVAVMSARIGTSLNGGVIGNLLAEFWPDIRMRVLPHVNPWKKSGKI